MQKEHWASPFEEIAPVSCLKNVLPFLKLSEGQCDKTLLTKDRPPAQIWGEKKHWEKFTCIVIFMFVSMWCCVGENKINYEIDCVEVDKCQYPYVNSKSVFARFWEIVSHISNRWKEADNDTFHGMWIDYKRVNLKNMQWQNWLLLRTVSSPRTNEFSKNRFCPPCAGKTLLALSTSRIVCQDKSIDKKVEAAKKHQLVSFALSIIIFIFLSHLLVSTVAAYIYPDSHFVLVNL